MKEKLEIYILNAARALGISLERVVVEHPADTKNGDYATNIALAISKQLGKNPREVAEMLVAEFNKNLLPEIDAVEIAGPGFINFRLKPEFFQKEVTGIVSAGEAFGKTDLFKNQTWAIEYASPNPNKAMHLGHLRNVLTGVSICRILEANNANVIREMVDNNRGIAIAKLMWGYLVSAKKDGARIEDISYWVAHQDEWQTAEDAGMTPDRFVDELYVKGATECENPEIENKVRDMVVKWEAKDADIWKLWEKVLSYAYEGQKRTLKRLGATFDFVWHEHEHYEEGKAYVEEGLKKGVFKKLEDGAILTDLERYNLTDTVVVKKDGTALYITQDIALTDIKKKKHNADKLIWVIGPEQSLAMQQMFAVCEQLGIGKREEFIHVPYGYMSLKGQGKMSSRKGNVVYIDDVIDEARSRVLELMKDREVANLDETSEQIAFAAVAFSILKAGRLTDTAFDFDLALRLEGDTGPYLQYAAVRANSIVAKAKDQGIVPSDLPAGGDWQTTNLEKHLYRFPEVVAAAGTDLAPNAIATYLLELSSEFNSFYGSTQIIDINDSYSGYKVKLTQAFAQTMKNGLYLLGISVPEKM
jgi:arginyl-tRNA synthetase